MKDEFYEIVNGKIELTDKGKEFVSKYLVSEVIRAHSLPQPIVGRAIYQQPTPNYTSLKDFADRCFKNDYPGYRAWMSRYLTGSPTGRFNINQPPPYQTLKGGSVDDKPVIPVSGMQGFSEKGAPEDWDLAIGEVYGYRWWKIQVPAKFAGYLEAPDRTLDASHSRLIGANLQPWDNKRMEAKCTASSTKNAPSWDDLLEGRKPVMHEPPEIRVACGCGFWAYFDQHLDVDQHFSNLSSGKPHRTADLVELPVFGVIKGTGRVIVGEKGFRSQYAEIVGLCLPELAQNQLGWWTKPVVTEDYRDYRLRRARNTNFYSAAMGSPGWYTTDNRRTATESVEATRDEVMGRIAFVEGMLSTLYPDAKLMSDQDALCAYFPPDKNYS